MKNDNFLKSKSHNQLPSNAKLVFKGEVFEVWQWEQKMYDGTVEIFEKLKRANTTGVIAIVEDKILIQSQLQPDSKNAFTSIPGGRCEKNENSLSAAKRELLEETGYISSDWELWGKVEPVHKIIWTSYTYIARNCIYKQQLHLDPGEKITNSLISFADFLMLSEDKNFYNKDLINIMLRARFDKKFREDFYKLLFKK